jgi:predicted AlkP superfamily pyrophosphatase or phosphodiesterase
MIIRRFKGTLLPIILVALIGYPATSQTRSPSKPKLIAFITIDAMRADYLPRFEKQLTGGLGRLLHIFSDESQAAVVVTLAPYNYWLTSYYQAQHGSPNDLDAQVPIIFYGRNVRPGRYGEFARVVDMAPTLAAIVRVTPQEKLDGHVLQHAIR